MIAKQHLMKMGYVFYISDMVMIKLFYQCKSDRKMYLIEEKKYKAKYVYTYL